MPQTQTARLLRLLSLLQSRREWSGSELAGRLEVTGRTIRRDVDQLRELGYPIEGTTGAAGGYRLRSGTNLPPLLLDDDEAIAIAAGLRTAAGAGIAGVDEASVRALAKLEQLLPARLRLQIDAAAGATTAVAVPRGAALDPTTLGSVAAACRDHEVLAFEYLTREGVTGRRRVEPHSLVAVTGLWYLVAYDLARDGWRVYRLDRVAHPVPTRNHFVPRQLPAGGPADLLRQRLREAPYRYRVTATVGLPAAQVRALLPRLLPARLREVGPDTCEVELGDDALGAVVADLTRLEADLRLEGPPETLNAIAQMARRLAQAADPGPDRWPGERMNPGLCERCRHGTPIPGARSVFWFCERSRTDPAYPRYPPLPVVACPGFEDPVASPTERPDPAQPPDDRRAARCTRPARSGPPGRSGTSTA